MQEVTRFLAPLVVARSVRLPVVELSAKAMVIVVLPLAVILVSVLILDLAVPIELSVSDRALVDCA